MGDSFFCFFYRWWTDERNRCEEGGGGDHVRKSLVACLFGDISLRIMYYTDKVYAATLPRLLLLAYHLSTCTVALLQRSFDAPLTPSTCVTVCMLRALRTAVDITGN